MSVLFISTLLYATPFSHLANNLVRGSVRLVRIAIVTVQQGALRDKINLAISF
jgi:hypothetical protein